MVLHNIPVRPRFQLALEFLLFKGDVSDFINFAVLLLLYPADS